ncbi:MAG: tripartite tricarboxylate transporter substrate binding protein [Burkholderiaceae bacterium]|nr:tripartite tricarboxylate transporter substrate binding protein [Burkholderiaceae bacterium]
MSHAKLSRRALLGLTLSGLAGAVSTPTSAQTASTWPERPIRFIVAGPPGGGNDIFTRMVAAQVQTSLKQTVVVENKPGANGLIGNDAVAKSPKDGHTFLFTASSSIAINPLVVAKMPYDTERDLVPVAQLGAGGILLMSNPASGLKNLQDLVKYAKANPGKLSYGSWGNGSTGHLVMEGIKEAYGLDIPHVPYKSTAAEVMDLLSDNLRLAFTDIASPLPHIRSGKLVALGATGSARGPALPDLPTLAEQGYKFEAEGWFGVFAPGGTPPAIVQRMNDEINKALALPEMRQRFADQNMLVPAGKNAQQFAATVKGDLQRWQALAKAINLKAE